MLARDCAARNRFTNRRDGSEVTRAHDEASVAVVEFQEAFGDEKDVVRLVVVVEARRVGNDCIALEDAHGAARLPGGGKDSKDTFAARYGNCFALKLRDNVGAPLIRRLVEAGDSSHGECVGSA